MINYLIEVEWRKYASMNYGNIGSDNGLSIGNLGKIFSEIVIEI